jgi:hypothetical protein
MKLSNVDEVGQILRRSGISMNNITGAKTLKKNS